MYVHPLGICVDHEYLDIPYMYISHTCIYVYLSHNVTMLAYMPASWGLYLGDSLGSFIIDGIVLRLDGNRRSFPFRDGLVEAPRLHVGHLAAHRGIACYTRRHSNASAQQFCTLLLLSPRDLVNVFLS